MCIRDRLDSIEWFQPDIVSKAYNLMYSWETIDPEQGLQLLDGRCPDPKVRAFAVQSLFELDDKTLQCHLLALTLALEKEYYPDNALSRFLLRRALIKFETIGVQLFWHLQTENFNSKLISKNKRILAAVLVQCICLLYTSPSPRD